MIDFIKDLPSAIMVDGKSFLINTDFRYWLKFIKILKKKPLYFSDCDFLLVDSTMDEKKLVECVKFFQNKNQIPNAEPSDIKVIDYFIDSDYIYSIFKERYNIDLCDEELHWHKFLALFRGIMNRYDDIVGYRAYKGDNKAYLKVKSEWALPADSEITERKRSVLNILLGDGDFAKRGE